VLVHRIVDPLRGGTATQWLDAPTSTAAALGNTCSSRLRIAMACSNIVDERQRHARTIDVSVIAALPFNL
jgi:hypothetical protein